jgi:O-antigen/teichoic acid export membrane protein
MRRRKSSSRDAGDAISVEAHHQWYVKERIRTLHALSRRGIWGLLLFLLISLGAVQEFSFFPPLSQEMRQWLGPAPPVRMISIALIVYSFSALILTLSRIWNGTGSYRGWSHLGYLGAFYGFYGFADSLGENFFAVFIAGLTILGLEYYHIRTYCQEALARELEGVPAELPKDDT